MFYALTVSIVKKKKQHISTMTEGILNDLSVLFMENYYQILVK